MLLASSINCGVLQSLAEGPKQQTELRRAASSPAQTTLRAQLRKLSDAGLIDRRRRNAFPGAVEHELTDAGRDLIQVAKTLQGWLRHSPAGPLELGGRDAQAAIKALIDGWSTAMLRVLATKPLTLTELDGLISSLNYPSLERRLAAMKLAGQVKQVPGKGRGTPYEVTEWARHAVAPLTLAARWEHRHLGEAAASISKADIEGSFLLAIPLVTLPADLSGACRLAVGTAGGKLERFAGVVVKVDAGRIASCATHLNGHPGAWASGPIVAWLAALIDRESDGLEIGGDGRLARALLDGLNESLFGLDPIGRPG